eukprot:gene18603-22259_t
MTNSSSTYASFILDALIDGFLQPDTWIVMDNASIHHQKDIAPVIRTILSLFNITVIHLPTYSPELNPIELLFGAIKRSLRDHKHGGVSFLDLLRRYFKLHTEDYRYIKSNEQKVK